MFNEETVIAAGYLILFTYIARVRLVHHLHHASYLLWIITLFRHSIHGVEITFGCYGALYGWFRRELDHQDSLQGLGRGSHQPYQVCSRELSC